MPRKLRYRRIGEILVALTLAIVGFTTPGCDIQEEPDSVPAFDEAAAQVVRDELETMRIIPEGSDVPLAGVELREYLREVNEISFEQLEQRITLPDECAGIDSIVVISQDGSVVDAQNPTEIIGPDDDLTDVDPHMDGRDAVFSYEVLEGPDGKELVFRSPYNNRFVFQIVCVDESGGHLRFEAECPGATTDAGEEVAAGDCGYPYAGRKSILVCGISAARFEPQSRQDAFVDLIEFAIEQLGGAPKLNVLGTTPAEEGEPSFFYVWIDAYWIDVCTSLLADRLEVIAAAVGAEVETDGNMIRVLGSDAGGDCPGNFLSPGGRSTGHAGGDLQASGRIVGCNDCGVHAVQGEVE